MTHTRLLPVILLAIGLSSAAHADDSCKLLFDADKKMVLSPHHSFSTITVPSQKAPRISESIFMGGMNGAVYILSQGKWMRSNYGPDEVLKQKEENIRDSKSSCRYLRDEAVNGESAAVYSIHVEDEDSKSDGTIWLGKSKGLPLREELDFDLSPGTMHTAVRYDYSNVRAPM